jgi:hypothetical protein
MTAEIARVTVAIIMAEAVHCGRGRVIWTRPPRLEVEEPYDVLDRFPASVREILALAALFREQARHPGSPPFLRLVTHPGDGCLSCGDPAWQDGFRCVPCALAVALALDRVPPVFEVPA